MPFLLDDAFCCHKRIKYGSRGDPVTIISDCVTVLIVAGPDGNRFPVLKIKVSEDLIPEKPVPIEEPVFNPGPLTTKPVSRKKKSGPPNQQHLF